MTLRHALDAFDEWWQKVREGIPVHYEQGVCKYPMGTGPNHQGATVESDPGLVCYGCAHAASVAPFPGHPSGESACMTCIRNPERVETLEPNIPMYLMGFRGVASKDMYTSLYMLGAFVKENRAKADYARMHADTTTALLTADRQAKELNDEILRLNLDIDRLTAERDAAQETAAEYEKRELGDKSSKEFPA
jgi:hypothetical protein